MSPRPTSLYSKKEFIYECCLRGLQGSLSNPAQQVSVASIVRDAEKLWHELREWEQKNPESDDE